MNGDPTTRKMTNGQHTQLKTRKGNIYISNLSYGITEAHIQTIFGEIGHVQKTIVNHDHNGKSMGTAIVVFERHEDAVKAIQKYYRVPLAGRPMVLKLCGKHPQTRSIPRKGFTKGCGAVKTQQHGRHGVTRRHGDFIRHGGRLQPQPTDVVTTNRQTPHAEFPGHREVSHIKEIDIDTLTKQFEKMKLKSDEIPGQSRNYTYCLNKTGPISCVQQSHSEDSPQKTEKSGFCRLILLNANDPKKPLFYF